MPSLSECLKLNKAFSTKEGRELKRDAKAFTDDGMSEHDAEQKAVFEKLIDFESERDSISGLIENETGEKPEAAKVSPKVE
jgi:hypothetical protein